MNSAAYICGWCYSFRACLHSPHLANWKVAWPGGNRTATCGDKISKYRSNYKIGFGNITYFNRFDLIAQLIERSTIEIKGHGFDSHGLGLPSVETLRVTSAKKNSRLSQQKSYLRKHFSTTYPRNFIQQVIIQSSFIQIRFSRLRDIEKILLNGKNISRPW